MLNNIKKNNSLFSLRKNVSVILLILFSFFVSKNAEAASIFFSPAEGNFDVGDTFKVNVLVNTQNVPINSIETNINFPKKYLDVVFVSKASSIFPLWIAEPTYSNSVGTISFTGGLPTPGYNGINGKIIEVTFRAKAAGTAIINYSQSAIRANDGLGTDVLQSSGEGEYIINVTPEVPVVVPTTEIKPTVALAPEISSISHLDSEKWYSDKNPKFLWSYPNIINGIRISYDENQTGTPEIFYSTTTLDKEFDNVSDGIHYLHLQVRDKNGWSEISNFKFQIDTERPINFAITEIDKENTTKNQTEFTFNAADELSGLDHFEIKIDDSSPEIISNVSNQYYKTAVLSSGKHVIFIKAYDKAGNFVPSSEMFYTNLSGVSTSTGKIFSYLAGYISKSYENTLLVIGDFIKNLKSIINSPQGSSIVELISVIGLIIGGILIPILAFAAPFLLSDIFLILSRMLGSLTGLRKKYHSWGTIYDSVTKIPLDLVFVSLIDLESGRQVATSITDSDGRYGFLTMPGRYGIETRKTSYISPSLNMRGRIFDEVYSNLYFGEEIIITKDGEKVVKNIPMDSLYFNWNRFVRSRMNINISTNIKDFVRVLLNILFVIGVLVSVIAVVYNPETYNIVIVSLYAIVGLLDITVFKKQINGILTDENTGLPLSYSIVSIYREGSDNPIIKKVADKYGAYYTLVPSGRYHIAVDVKNDDGSYSEALFTRAIDIKDGVINFNIKI